MAGRYKQAGTVRERVRHKSRAQGAPSSLWVYMYAIQHISKEENETISGAWEKSAAADSAEPNSKAILQHLRLLFLLRQNWRVPSFFQMPMFL